MSAEAHEMDEKTPLKSDTDKPAGTEETTTEVSTKENDDGTKTTVTKTTTVKRFGNFFRRAPKDKTDEAMGEEKTEMTATPPPATEDAAKDKAPKKPIWPPAWLKKSKEGAKAKVCGDDDMTIGLNINDRDERNINEHIKLSFEDILGEPDTNHSWDCAWRVTFRTFNAVRCFIYKLLALIVALPCAIIWGVVFAILAVINVWAATPLARALTVPALWIAKVWNFVIRSIFDPMFRSCGLCLGSIHMRRYGMSTDATAEMA